jgi:hypothetical protein
VALGFVLFAAVFFTLSRSKLVTYLLPALPPLAWLAAAAWGRVSPAARRPALGLVLLVTPLILIAGRPWLLAYARTQSGEGLAAAIRVAGGGPVHYQACYSPGTDYRLGRNGVLLDADGENTTSNYQLRYRDTLIARGQWTPRESGSALADAGVRILVRDARRVEAPPEGWAEFHRDRRFVAWRRTGPR